MFWEQWCGYCVKTKPDFAQFSHMIAGSPIRAFAIEGSKNKALMSRINPAIWGYQVRGYPTIVGYFNGKFYSEYAPSTGGSGAPFRSADDLVEYARGLGTATVESK
jgi:thiol-disulfide isomerase/thioredoxin